MITRGRYCLSAAIQNRNIHITTAIIIAVILPVNNRKQLDVSRSEIICRICDEGVIGDETHFLFECPK